MGRGKKPGESVKNRAVKSNKFSSQRTKKDKNNNNKNWLPAK